MTPPNMDPAAAAAAGAATGAAAWFASWSVIIFGAPLPVVLAGLAGALVALSFLPPSTFLRAVATVAGSTLCAAYLEPLAQHMADLPQRLALGLAFGIGLLAQPVIAWAMGNIPAALDRVTSWGRK